MIPVRIARSLYVRLVAIALLLLPLILVGCNVKSGGFITTLPVHVRVLNALVDGGQVSVAIGDTTVASGLPFEGLPTYQDAYSGNQEIKVSVGNGPTLVDRTP